MMTETEYLYAWLYYLGGALILVACLWFLVRKIAWPRVKYTLLVVVGVALVTPWYTDIQETYLSPAIIVSAVEGVFEGPEAFWRAGAPLLAAMGGALLLCVVTFSIHWYFRRSHPASNDGAPASISEVHLD